MDSIPRNDSLDNLVGEYKIFLSCALHGLSEAALIAGRLVWYFLCDIQ